MTVFEEAYIEKLLFEQAVGAAVLRYMRKYEPQNLLMELNSEAAKILQEIQTILDDNSLDDAECFHRIEAIVSAFHQHGVSTSRHDLG